MLIMAIMTIMILMIINARHDQSDNNDAPKMTAAEAQNSHRPGKGKMNIMTFNKVLYLKKKLMLK